MIKEQIKMLILAILAIMCFSSIASAQGFSSIMNKLDELEARLDGLDGGQTNVDVARLEKSIAGLRAKVNDLAQSLDEVNASEGSDGSSQQIEALAADLQAVSGELRNALSAPTSGIEGLDITGFVDASYFYDANSGGNSFGFDQAEVDIEKTFGEVGSVRVDVEWASDGAGGFDLDAEQGYVTFKPSAHNPVSFTFGKFNAPIGFELLDAPDMYQFSHALVFDYGLPTNLTGLMVSTQINPTTDISLYVCNGWDQNVDFNTGKTAGGRLGWTNGSTFAGGISAIYGADLVSTTVDSLGEVIETTYPEGDNRIVFDIDASLTLDNGWTFGGEFNSGTDKVGDEKFQWSGFLVMGHYDFNGWAGVTARYDYFDDTDGTRLGTIEKRQAVTIAPTFVLGDGMGALIEFRMDTSDQEVFTDSDGEPTKKISGVAFEMTYTF